MDIKLTDSLLRQYLHTPASPQEIAEKLSLCGPTVDRLEQTDKDWIYYIEVITNRVDAASAFGIAREANAILPQFNIQSSIKNDPYTITLDQLGPLPDNKPVTVEISDNSLIPRFACIALANVKVKPSPEKVQDILTQGGVRSLNNVIDVSNELTLKYGQPVHIFDLDTIKGNFMRLRESVAGEKIATLDGKTHTLTGGDIVIEDGEGRLIDLCGVMGGQLSEVTDTTTTILLFVQNYEPKHIRKTSLKTQERTLAAQLIEKQPDPNLVLPVLIEGVRLLKERTGGTIASGLIDIYNKPPQPKSVTIDLNWLDSFTGVPLPRQQVVDILTRLGFSSKQHNDSKLECQVPSWRIHDISIKEDLAEEITRVYGYFRLPSVLPATTIPQTGTDPILRLETETKLHLKNLGFTEIYNYSLISKELIKLTTAGEKALFQLSNPLSEEFVYMRQSLLPSLLQNLALNRGTVTPPLRIFEISNTYHKTAASPLADEIPHLAFACTNVSYREAKGYVESLAKTFHVPVRFSPLETDVLPFEKNKAAAVMTASGERLGTFGQADPKIVASQQLPAETYLCEINFTVFERHASLTHRFTPVPLNPPIIEDLTFTVPDKQPVEALIGSIKSVSPLIESVELKGMFNRNYTFTLTYRAANKTLTSDDISPLRKAVVTKLEALGTTLVGSLS